MQIDSSEKDRNSWMMSVTRSIPGIIYVASVGCDTNANGRWKSNK